MPSVHFASRWFEPFFKTASTQLGIAGRPLQIYIWNLLSCQ
jgi:hypothetical protein